MGSKESHDKKSKEANHHWSCCEPSGQHDTLDNDSSGKDNLNSKAIDGLGLVGGEKQPTEVETQKRMYFEQK